MAGRKRVDPLKRKVAIYIRVSTRWQVDGDSLPMQREELPKYVRYALDITDYEIFEDAGYSGKNTDRPAFQSMMARVRQGEFSHIVVWKLDRISRNLLDFAGMYAELKKLGVVFISKNEQFDTSTAIGEAMLKIILIFAELERNMTSERVASTMISRAQNGQWNGGRIPYGYYYDKDAGTFSINEVEAAIVRRMFEQYEKVHSLLAVAQWLNESGYRHRSGVPWNPVTVNLILKSPFYTGSYRYNYRDESKTSATKKKPGEWIVIEDHHPAIVDPARQAAIIRILENNERASNIHDHRTYERGNVHVFAGLLTCGCCGSTFQATSDRARASSGWRPSMYLCSRHRRFKDCDNKYISDVVLGPFVLNFLANYIKAERSFGRTTDKTVLAKKLLRGTYFDGVEIDDASLSAIHASFMASRFGIIPEATQDGQDCAQDAPNINEREILDREQRRLSRALERLKALYLYNDEEMSEKDYILESRELNAQLTKVNERLQAIEESQAVSMIDDEDFVEQASYLIITEELLSHRFVDYEKMLRTVDRRTLKLFVNSVCKNFCIFQGHVQSITLKNGIVVNFLHSAG